MATMQQLMCQGCYIMLMYPQGAANVRCSQCHHITPVASPAPAPPSAPAPGATPPPNQTPASSGAMHQAALQAPRAQLQCAGCQIVLMYPRGAANVQCAVCGVVSSAAQANTVAHIQCSGCRTWLMYSYGATSVKCALCETINNQVPLRQEPPPGMVQPAGTPQHGDINNTPMDAQGANGATDPSHMVTQAADADASGGPAMKQELSTPPVVVQNPSTLDDNGNPVEDVMLGYKDSGG